MKIYNVPRLKHSSNREKAHAKLHKEGNILFGDVVYSPKDSLLGAPPVITVYATHSKSILSRHFLPARLSDSCRNNRFMSTHVSVFSHTI
jgi:hypothetical protein